MPDKQRLLSDELAQRLAAIDIGSNSIRLVVAEALRGGNYRILDEERVATRLGRQLHSTSLLAEEAIEESLAALRRFREIAAGFQPRLIRTIATCAVREAKNGKEFCRRAKDELGLDVEVISAAKEAHLAFYSVQRSFDLTDKNVVLADIGGGSTEIVLASGNLIEAIYATQLGAVRLSEKFGSGQAMAGGDFGRMVKSIDRRLRKTIRKPFFRPHLLIGSGGTFTSLASMVMAQKGQADLPMRGYQVTRAELNHLVDRLRKLAPAARAGTPGLSPDRADIIVAGLATVDRIMRRFKVNVLQVHHRGVRDGLMLTMLEKVSGNRTPSVDRAAAVERLAAASGTEVEHGRHVARLAGQIFEQMAPALSLSEADQPLLEAAARLQDVGYLIDYDRHHKHSYHLILNSRLPGFRPHELELIANIARYHRGAEPKKKHAHFRQLSRVDRQRVRQLAAILRLAGGLDRSHSQQISKLDVTCGDDDVEIRATADQYPDVDIWGARRRAGLFEKVFKRSLTVQWAGSNESEESDPPEAPPAKTAAGRA